MNGICPYLWREQLASYRSDLAKKQKQKQDDTSTVSGRPAAAIWALRPRDLRVSIRFCLRRGVAR